ncbi:MAG: ABC transporter permease [Clostridiales bacterium]|nr:ABC transporter permease [Clostridiales bacterium]
MPRYIVKHFISSLITLFFVVTITFFLMQAAPGNPFMNERSDPRVVARLMERYGYDRPVWEQYLNYLKDLARGDFGMSITDRSGLTVMEMLGRYFPNSAKIGAICAALSIALALPLGLLAAVRHDTLFDRCFIFLASLLSSMPNFVVAVALMLCFGVWLKVLPVAYLTDWKSYVLPVFSMALPQIFGLARLMRTTMLDVVGQDYIRTARAKGLPAYKVMFKHAFRNAMLPVVTAVGPMIAMVLTGSMVIEGLFAIAGVGKYYVGSIGARDYPMIMGTTIVFSGLIILANYVVDVLYGIIDPRIKLQ